MTKPGSSPDTQSDQAEFAYGVLRAEAEAIGRIKIDAAFHRAVDLILDVVGSHKEHATAASGPGNVVVTGLGKSGLIGQKISATLASTGTPSHFLHPVEAFHGDLGRVRRGDVVILLSFGGNTDEVVALASILKQDGVPMIAIVGKAECDLGRLATVTLTIGDVAEACPMNLAPTASTTAMLALGDALALAVSRRRDFGVEDFRKFHPAGGLGRELMPVVEAIRFKAGVNLPLFTADATVQHAFEEAERAVQAVPGLRRPGALLIVDKSGVLTGIFTDGDLRRAFLKGGRDAWTQPIGTFMKAGPRRLPHTALVRDAVQLMREYRIDEIPVVDEAGNPVGLVDVQDLVALKVIEG